MDYYRNGGIIGMGQGFSTVSVGPKYLFCPFPISVRATGAKISGASTTLFRGQMLFHASDMMPAYL